MAQEPLEDTTTLVHVIGKKLVRDICKLDILGKYLKLYTTFIVSKITL